MPRSVAELSKGARITDFISLGVISKTFSLEKVNKAIRDAGKASQRQRGLPAHVVCYYVIALALYVSGSAPLSSRGYPMAQGAGDHSAGERQVGDLPGSKEAGL